MKAWIRRWMPTAWRDRPHLLRVAGEYRALKNSRHLLADLCLRNSVFAHSDAQNLFEAGVAEGRRRCVLEILQLADTDPMEIADLDRGG